MTFPRPSLAAIAALIALAVPVIDPAAADPPEPIVPSADGPFTLVSSDSGLVLMLDALGVPVRSWTVPGVTNLVVDKELLPNGHLLVTVIGPVDIWNEVGRGVDVVWPLYDVVADPVGSAVAVLDENSVPVWSITSAGGVPLTWTHDTDYIEATDTFLIADTTSTPQFADRIVEVDRAGNIVWAYYPPEDSYPNDADRLPNGNTLVSLRNHNQAIEVAPDGSIVWSVGEPGQGTIMDGIHNPDRLLNGNTIIADSNHDRIVEFNPAGEIVWEYGGEGVLRWPRDADVLPNGNVLIADSFHARVIEVTRAGEVVWEAYPGSVGTNYDVDRVNDVPVIAIAEPAAGATVTNPVAFDVTATDPSLAGATYRVFDVTDDRYVDPAPLPLPAAPWTRTLTPGHEYRLEVDAWDAGGEGGGWPQDDSVPEGARGTRAFSVA